MTKPPTLLLALSLLTVPTACSAPELEGELSADRSSTRRPNVIVIVSDDHRWDVAGYNGNEYIPTPHLDRLAGEGVNFVNAFATSGVCSPSRASILTGKYSHQCGSPRIAWMNHTFHRQETSFFARLQDAGYRTSYVGKWHLGRGHQPKPGFDSWASFEWLGAYFNTQIWIDGEMRQGEGFADDIISELAAERIAARAKSDEPFALFVGLKSPHLNFSYPPRHEHAFDEISIPRPATYDEDRAAAGKQALANTGIDIEDFIGGLPMFENSWDVYVESYYRSVMAIDDAVGTILAAVDEAGIGDETLVLYTSDQGYSLGDHGLTEKHYAYEGPARVPMLVRYPGLASAGIVRDEMVLNIDIAPTVLELCGIPVPGEMSGASWNPLFEASASETPEWREDFLFDLSSQGAVIPSQLMVRTATHKLITYPDFPEPELYDLVRDPLEAISVIDDPAYAEVRADMEARLARLVEETDWVPRHAYPVGACWLLGPVPPDALDEVRAGVLAHTFDLAGPRIEGKGQVYEWRRSSADAAGNMPLGVTATAPAGHRSFLALPIRLLAERDPYVQLSHSPPRLFRVHVNGEQTETGFILHHPSSTVNPPLCPGENLVILELDPGAPKVIRLVLDAPENSVEFP
jgi:arylsulfatase A-like enzyme